VLICIAVHFPHLLLRNKSNGDLDVPPKQQRLPKRWENVRPNYGALPLSDV
jgi:hypothetical protein|tara:strand:- start:646 stop:798 length:153 start_codon:yes stop_codon:yes gene_type:complete